MAVGAAGRVVGGRVFTQKRRYPSILFPRLANRACDARRTLTDITGSGAGCCCFEQLRRTFGASLVKIRRFVKYRAVKLRDIVTTKRKVLLNVEPVSETW